MSFESECWTGLMGVRQVLACSVARTLVDLRETCENATQEERRDLVHVLIQEVGVDVDAKYILWMKVLPDYELLFSNLDGLRLDSERRCWIDHREAEENIGDIEVDNVQMSAGVEIQLTMSHNTLTIAEEYIQ